MLRKYKDDARTKAALSFSRVRIPGSKCQVIRGVTKTIKTTFFHSKRIVATPVSHQKQQQQKHPKGRNAFQKRGGMRSMKRGCVVHSQVEKICQGIRPSYVHPYTAQILHVLRSEGLKILKNEASLISFDGCYYTKSDAIGSRLDVTGNNERELNVISFKTGFDDSTLTTEDKRPCKNAARGKVGNTKLSEHMMQLACEMYCLEHEYGVPLGDGIIIYAGYGPKKETRVEYTRDYPWTRDRAFMKQIHDDLRKRAPQEQKDALDKLKQTVVIDLVDD